MAKITLEIIIKIAEIITGIAIVVSETLKGGKKDDKYGSSEKK